MMVQLYKGCFGVTRGGDGVPQEVVGPMNVPPRLKEWADIVVADAFGNGGVMGWCLGGRFCPGRTMYEDIIAVFPDRHSAEDALAAMHGITVVRGKYESYTDKIAAVIGDADAFVLDPARDREPLPGAPGGAVSADDTRQFIITLDALKAAYAAAREADIDLVSAMWMNISMDCAKPGGEWPKEDLGNGHMVDVDPESLAKAWGQDVVDRMLAASRPAEPAGEYTLSTEHARVLDAVKTAPQWDTKLDRLAEPEPADVAAQLAKLRETFCLASPGSDEGITAWLEGFDAAASIITAPASPVIADQGAQAEIKEPMTLSDIEEEIGLLGDDLTYFPQLAAKNLHVRAYNLRKALAALIAAAQEAKP